MNALLVAFLATIAVTAADNQIEINLATILAALAGHRPPPFNSDQAILVPADLFPNASAPDAPVPDAPAPNAPAPNAPAPNAPAPNAPAPDAPAPDAPNSAPCNCQGAAPAPPGNWNGIAIFVPSYNNGAASAPLIYWNGAALAAPADPYAKKRAARVTVAAAVVRPETREAPILGASPRGAEVAGPAAHGTTLAPAVGADR